MLRNGLAEWTEPLVGLSLVRSFFGQAFLASGEIRLQDAFMLGVAIGLDRNLRSMIVDKTNSEALHVLEPRFIWNSYALASYLNEIELVVNSAKNVNGPKNPIIFSDNPLADTKENYAEYEEWIREEFLKKRKEFIESFELGTDCSIILDESFRDMTGGALSKSYSEICKVLEGWKNFALKLSDDPDTYKNNEQQISIEFLRKLKVSTIAEVVQMMNVIDFFIPVIFHELNDVAMTNIDWDWLKQGVLEMRERGEMPAVVLDASGNLGTMKITDPIMKIMGDVSDTTKQVLFLNRFSGMATLAKTDWADLESGIALKIP